MKVLLNASTVRVGGGIQVATELLKQIDRNNMGCEWVGLVSPQVSDEYHSEIVDSVIRRSPAKSHAARRKVEMAERRLKPDVVFTVFGPAYARFRAPHLCGVADGWVTHATSAVYRRLGWHRRIRTSALVQLKKIWFRRADQWVVEADCAQEGLISRLGIDERKIHVIPNTCAMQYHETTRFARSTRDRPVRILSFASGYAHKNLETIPYVAWHLRKLAPNLQFEMVVTLADECRYAKQIRQIGRELDVSDLIVNRGPIAIEDGPALYSDCTICLMPSLLETFSATYPEAMAMRMPIVATDLPFAHDCCGKAAVYFAPDSPLHAAQAITRIVEEDALTNSLISEGTRQLAKFPSSAERFASYVDIMNKMLGA